MANILLILGLSFLAGGFRRTAQYYNTTSAHVSSNLLSLAATSLLIPTASKLLGQTSEKKLARQSRGAAVVLIVVYLLFLFYQLKTHAKIFDEESEKVMVPPRLLNSGSITADGAHDQGAGRATAGRGFSRALTALSLGEETEPELSLPVAGFLFVASNVALFFLVDFIVNSTNDLTTAAHLSRTFIGLILLPIPNCDLGAIKSAINDDVDVTMTYTIGKCLQTALCITPLIILLAWWLGVDGVTLVFDGFESSVCLPRSCCSISS